MIWRKTTIKIPEQVTNYEPCQISQIKFWPRKTNKQKGYFSQYALPIQKAETQNTHLLDNMYLNNTKALTKVTKDHQKKPKKPHYNYHLQQIDSYNQWRELIQ